MGPPRARRRGSMALGDVCEGGERLVDTAACWRLQESNLGALLVPWVTGRLQARLTGMGMCAELGEERNGDWWCPLATGEDQVWVPSALLLKDTEFACSPAFFPLGSQSAA